VTRKHFCQLATILTESFVYLVSRTESMCQDQNPEFSRNKFRSFIIDLLSRTWDIE